MYRVVDQTSHPIAMSLSDGVGFGRYLFAEFVGQAHERRQVQLLGTQAAVNAGGFDFGAAEQ